jgi:type II secretory pathway predicted ATPase ExeA
MLEVFGCRKEPFLPELGPGEAFQWRDFREGLRRLDYGLKCRGLLCLVGKNGCGKTTLLRHFVEQLPAGLYKTLALHHTSGSPVDLLLHVSHQLGLEPSNLRSRLVQNIQTECAQLASRRLQPLLLVDEAHFLSNQALHELRLLLTSQLEAQRHFVLILGGHPDLEGRLRTPWLEALRQRITTWVRLTALSAEETGPYLAHRLKLVGIPINLFSPEAVFALQQLSGGLLRPLDRLAHHALIACALDSAKQVSEEHVRQAAEEVGL